MHARSPPAAFRPTFLLTLMRAELKTNKNKVAEQRNFLCVGLPAAVFPLVVKRRSCLPQLDPLKHGRSFAVSWPYFWSSSLCIPVPVLVWIFLLIGRVHEVLYSYINLVSCLVLYMYSCTGTS